MNALEEKARCAFYAIKGKFTQTDIHVTVWCKIFNSVIMHMALYGCEVWGPQCQTDYYKWDKQRIEWFMLNSV